MSYLPLLCTALTLLVPVLIGCGDVEDPVEKDISSKEFAAVANCSAGDCGSYLGSFRKTFYILATEWDYIDNPKDTPAYDGNGNVIGWYPAEFLADLCLQGSGIALDATPITIDWLGCAPGKTTTVTSAESPGRRCVNTCFRTLDPQLYPMGITRNGETPVPLRSAAVWAPQVSLGSTLYIPQFDGYSVPNSGLIHDGCIKANDTGGAITNSRIDIHAGTGRYETSLYYAVAPAFGSQVDVYLNSPRCAGKALTPFFPLDVALGIPRDTPPTVPPTSTPTHPTPITPSSDISPPPEPVIPDPVASGNAYAHCIGVYTTESGASAHIGWTCEDPAYPECGPREGKVFTCKAKGKGGHPRFAFRDQDVYACVAALESACRPDWIAIPLCDNTRNSAEASMSSATTSGSALFCRDGEIFDHVSHTYRWVERTGDRSYCSQILSSSDEIIAHVEQCRNSYPSDYRWEQGLFSGVRCVEYAPNGRQIGDVVEFYCRRSPGTAFRWKRTLAITAVYCAEFGLGTDIEISAVDAQRCRETAGQETEYRWERYLFSHECREYIKAGTLAGVRVATVADTLCGQ